MNITESANMIVRLAIGTAALEGGSPDMILIDEVDRLSTALASEAIANGMISPEHEETFVIVAKGQLYKAAFIAWDEIVEGDGWKGIALPWERWSDDIKATTKALTENAALDLSGDPSRRRAMNAGKHLALACQRRAAELIRGYPLPRAGRTAIVDALSDLAMETFERRLTELSMSGNKAGGRA
jgi:hypothetical protein